MKKGTEGREPGIWVLVYLQPAALSPRVAGPAVHLQILHLFEEPAGPHLSRKFGLCWQCGLQGCAGLSLCITTAPGTFAWGVSAGLCPLKDNKLYSADVATGCPSPHGASIASVIA